MNTVNNITGDYMVKELVKKMTYMEVIRYLDRHKYWKLPDNNNLSDDMYWVDGETEEHYALANKGRTNKIFKCKVILTPKYNADKDYVYTIDTDSDDYLSLYKGLYTVENIKKIKEVLDDNGFKDIDKLIVDNAILQIK